MENSKFGTLNLKDLGNSIVNGVFVAVIGYLATLTSIWSVEPKQVLNVAILAILGTLAKALTTTQDNKLLGVIQM